MIRPGRARWRAGHNKGGMAKGWCLLIHADASLFGRVALPRKANELSSGDRGSFVGGRGEGRAGATMTLVFSPPPPPPPPPQQSSPPRMGRQGRVAQLPMAAWSVARVVGQRSLCAKLCSLPLPFTLLGVGQSWTRRLAQTVRLLSSDPSVTGHSWQ
jgi:hypothetical protein